MRWTRRLATLAIGLGLAAGISPARAQVIVIDDVILLSRSSSEREQARTREHLGAGGRREGLPPAPGAEEPTLSRPDRFGPRLNRATYRERQPDRTPIVPPTRPLTGSAPTPTLAGPLEVPPGDDDGPPDGLLLDTAIERLLTCNYDLRRYAQQLVKANADRLSAGLRNNPFLFMSADAVPYGSFSTQRPGDTSYDITVIQPIDVSGRRRNRILVAEQARHVVEAQYQDAVRREIDRLYTAYADVLESRELARAAHAGLERASQLAEATRVLKQRGVRSEAEVAEAVVRRFDAETTEQSAGVALMQAKRNLATLLALPPDAADRLAIRDSAEDRAPPPPNAEALAQLALRVRPDLAAYRLGVARAKADVQFERAEGIEDVYLFYAPFYAANYLPQNKEVATGWSLGVLLPIPIFNRNQGNIARARANVTQSKIALEGLERRIVNEVQNAAAAYHSTGGSVDRYEKEGLPALRHLREEKFRQYVEGKETLDGYLAFLGKYDDMIRRYLATRMIHRRAMLKLNTAVAQRVLP